MRVGEGSFLTRAASTSMDCDELVSSGMNSIPALGRGAAGVASVDMPMPA